MRLINFALLVHVIGINAAILNQYPDTAWGHLGDNKEVQLFSPQRAEIQGRAKFGNDKLLKIGTIRDVAESEGVKSTRHLNQQIFSQRPKLQGDISPSETYNQQYRYVSNDGFKPASQFKKKQYTPVSTGNTNLVNRGSNFPQLQQSDGNELFAQARRLRPRQRRHHSPHGRRRRRLRRKVKHHYIAYDGKQHDTDEEEDSEEWTSSEELSSDEEDFPVELKHGKKKNTGKPSINDSSKSSDSDSTSEDQKEVGKPNRKVKRACKGKGKGNCKSNRDEEDFPVELKHGKKKNTGKPSINDGSESSDSDSTSEEQKEVGRPNRKVKRARKGKGKTNRKSKVTKEKNAGKKGEEGRKTRSKTKRRKRENTKNFKMFTLNG